MVIAKFLPLVSIIAIALAIVCLHQGYRATDASIESIASRFVAVNPPAYEFGWVKQGSAVSKTFVLKNVSNGPIRIDSVQSSCSCTASKVSEAVLMPGDESKVDLVFKVGTRSGKVATSQSIIFSRVGQESHAYHVDLIVRGNVVADYTVSPSELVLDVAKASKASLRITRDPHLDDLRVLEAASTCPGVSISAPERDQDGDSWIVDVSYEPKSKTAEELNALQPRVIIQTDSVNQPTQQLRMIFTSSGA